MRHIIEVTVNVDDTWSKDNGIIQSEYASNETQWMSGDYCKVEESRILGNVFTKKEFQEAFATELFEKTYRDKK